MEMVLVILNRTGGIDAYHLYKIFYFAELAHLADQGVGMIPDEFRARENGPVPEAIYQALKPNADGSNELAGMLLEVVERGREDAQDILMARRSADLKSMNLRERTLLEKAADENASLTFHELREKSHDAAWRATARDAVIPLTAMGRVATSNPQMLAYMDEVARIESGAKTMKRRGRSVETISEAKKIMTMTSGRGIDTMRKWM